MSEHRGRKAGSGKKEKKINEGEKERNKSTGCFVGKRFGISVKTSQIASSLDISKQSKLRMRLA